MLFLTYSGNQKCSNVEVHETLDICYIYVIGLFVDNYVLFVFSLQKSFSFILYQGTASICVGH